MKHASDERTASRVVSEEDDITRLLSEGAGGNRRALDRIFPLVYQHLKGLAHARLRHERSDHTLNTTGLVHEAYLKLAGVKRIEWKNRDHFYAVASRIMRRVLVNYALARNADKRGGKNETLPLDESRVGATLWEKVIDLDAALESLEERYPRAADVVQHRYFGGFRNDEIAKIMNLSTRTIERDLEFARAWLARALRQSD